MEEQRIREIVRVEISIQKEEAAAVTATPTKEELINKGYDANKIQDLS